VQRADAHPGQFGQLAHAVLPGALAHERKYKL
jgi:hypothetical protein